MTPKPANASAVSETYELLRYAATRKQPKSRMENLSAADRNVLAKRSSSFSSADA
jgi:hypothetical protein